MNKQYEYILNNKPNQSSYDETLKGLELIEYNENEIEKIFNYAKEKTTTAANCFPLGS